MPSHTIENYVKTIYQLCNRSARDIAATGEVASALGVSPGTVTSMLKSLSDAGLVSYTPYEGVRLSPSGRKLALRVLRRHRLIEQFLATTLDLDWGEVHEEAENMEHAVSDLLVDRIEQFLGFPTTDPHGDPIPTADGEIAEPNYHCLAEFPPRSEFRLIRVVDQSPQFLQCLNEKGIGLGAEGQILDVAAATMQLEINGNPTELAREMAAKLMVVPA